MNPSLLKLVQEYGYAALFLGLALEGTGLPGPVELLFLAAGVLVQEGRLSLLGVILAASFGNLLGNLGGYALGALGGRPLVLRFGRRLGIDQRAIDRATVWFDRYGGRVVLFSRLLGLPRTPAIWASGLVGMSLFTYAVWSWLGDFIWSGIWSYIGLSFGLEWPRLYAHYRWAAELLVVAILTLAAGVLIRQRRRERGKSHAGGDS